MRPGVDTTEPRMLTSGARVMVNGRCARRGLVAHVDPANARPVIGVDDATTQAAVIAVVGVVVVRRDRAADEAQSHAHAEPAPAPAVVTPGRRGSGSERSRTKSGSGSENEGHLAEHVGLSSVGLDACFSSSCPLVVPI